MQVPIILVNWVAPCMLTAAVMRLQADLLADVLRGNCKDALCLMLMPQFAYKQSELWLAEQMVMQMLTERRLVGNRKWALMFQELVDAREKRPLVYDGRVVVPMEASDAPKDNILAGAKVLKGRTELAKQLAAKQMVVMEYFGEDQLPQTTDMAEVKVKGAAKYAQVGEDGMQKVLDAVMEGPDWGKCQGNTVLLLMELNPQVGNMLDAFMTRKASLRMPMHYTALVDNNNHWDWMKHTKTQLLQERHYKGELQVAGHPPPVKEMPSDLLEANPTKPVLNKLTIVEDGPEKKPTLRIPSEIVSTWSEHEKFKRDFETLVDNLETDLGDSFVRPGQEASKQESADSEAQSPLPGGKRPPGPAQAGAAKKRRVSQDKVIPEENMVGGPDLFRTPLVSSIGKDYSDVFLVVKPQHRIYILNKGTKDVDLPEGTLIAGFGKGKFKFREKEPDANPETHIPFLLTNHADRILYGTSLKTLKEVVDEKRKMQANPQICYHRMEEVPGGEVGGFNLVSTNEVLFGLLEQDAPKGETTGPKLLLANRMGALVPTKHWKNACMDIFWACQWTAIGLNAIRPVVTLTAGVVLPPGRALACN